MAKTIRLKSLRPLPERSVEVNDRLVKAHQEKLVRIQQALLFTGERAVVVFEGMDAAGKGGTIRRMAWAMDPRSLKVWPIAAPNEIERKEHYLQRFWTRLPEKTQIAVFDRSWYGRVLVERVEKLCKPREWKRAYHEINELEKMLADDGVAIVKLFMHISKKEQLRRFKEREKNPYKRWKITEEDWRNRRKWSRYEEAIDDMFRETHGKRAPWTVIAGEHKWFARIAVCRAVADALEDEL